MTASPQKRIVRRSQRREQQIAEDYGGRRNPGSGSSWSKRNDVRTSGLLIEHKFTDNKRSITLKAVDLEEHAKHAVLDDRLAVFLFDLNGRTYMVLSEADGQELLDACGIE